LPSRQQIQAESQTARITPWSSGEWRPSHVDAIVLESLQLFIVIHSIVVPFVCSRLGHKIQGVLCDGDSKEVVASTVVNCLKIDEGTTNTIYEQTYPVKILHHIKTSLSLFDSSPQVPLASLGRAVSLL
jgi:hypothetical protein